MSFSLWLPWLCNNNAWKIDCSQLGKGIIWKSIKYNFGSNFSRVNNWIQLKGMQHEPFTNGAQFSKLLFYTFWHPTMTWIISHNILFKSCNQCLSNQIQITNSSNFDTMTYIISLNVAPDLLTWHWQPIKRSTHFDIFWITWQGDLPGNQATLYGDSTQFETFLRILYTHLYKRTELTGRN